MVKGFVRAGYAPGETLFGAPFDFRLHLRGIVLQSAFGNALFQLVEAAYAKNRQAKVHLVSHSYGCLVLAYWMEHFRPKGFSDSQWDAWIQGLNIIYIC